METSDKAVSTEDLERELLKNRTLEVASKLEQVLSTLVESKVESFKQEELLNSINSSPKSLIQRLRITSTSTVSSKYDESTKNGNDKKKLKSPKKTALKQISPTLYKEKKDLITTSKELANVHHYENICNDRLCATENCCCKKAQLINMHYDDDYISLKIDEYDNLEDEILSQDARKRARRKRRRRRKKRMKRHMALNPMTMLPPEETIKVLHDADDLPQRARWTIVATACLLLFMCLLLVGITLRMAPIIDDMVREENAKLMNSLIREPSDKSTSNQQPST